MKVHDLTKPLICAFTLNFCDITNDRKVDKLPGAGAGMGDVGSQAHVQQFIHLCLTPHVTPFYARHRTAHICGQSKELLISLCFCKMTWLRVAFAVLALLALTRQVSASHFRYGSIEWTRPSAASTQVSFKVSTGWRRGLFRSSMGSPMVLGDGRKHNCKSLFFPAVFYPHRRQCSSQTSRLLNVLARRRRSVLFRESSPAFLMHGMLHNRQVEGVRDVWKGEQ
jgi:hypothetical protein